MCTCQSQAEVDGKGFMLRYEDGEIGVSTNNELETAVWHPDYSDGATIIVANNATKREAFQEHDGYVHFMCAIGNLDDRSIIDVFGKKHERMTEEKKILQILERVEDDFGIKENTTIKALKAAFECGRVFDKKNPSNPYIPSDS